MYPIVVFDALRVKNPRCGQPQDHLHYHCHGKPEPGNPEIDQDAPDGPRVAGRGRPPGKAPGGPHGSFPTGEAATKLIHLAIRNFEKGGRTVRERFAARTQFAILSDERFNA